MALYTLVLDAYKHNKFLEEHRKDPFTGKAIEAGDEITVCAKCKSAFLLDSWRAIGNQHCNQSETLAKIFIIDKNVRLRSKPKSEESLRLAALKTFKKWGWKSAKTSNKWRWRG